MGPCRSPTSDRVRRGTSPPAGSIATRRWSGPSSWRSARQSSTTSSGCRTTTAAREPARRDRARASGLAVGPGSERGSHHRARCSRATRSCSSATTRTTTHGSSWTADRRTPPRPGWFRWRTRSSRIQPFASSPTCHWLDRLAARLRLAVDPRAEPARPRGGLSRLSPTSRQAAGPGPDVLPDMTRPGAVRNHRAV